MTDVTRRRGHAAIGGRILAAGLSTGAAVALAAVMADGANRHSGVGDSPEPIAVRVVMPDGRQVESTVVPPPTIAVAPAEAPTSGSSHES